MAKTLAVVIQEDPTKTHRPVEALRIALGLAAGSHRVTVILLGESVRLLSDDTEDIVGVEVLEKLLPSIQHLAIPFIIDRESTPWVVNCKFCITYEPAEIIRSLIRSVDCALIF